VEDASTKFYWKLSWQLSLIKMASVARHIVVSGANSGIGAALARQLVDERGCHVYLGTRSLEKGEAALAGFGLPEDKARDFVNFVSKVSITIT
jgi:NAD(P)-dependent dehydrogenase (short-subunit alcohol dehydrogenase family)